MSEPTTEPTCPSCGAKLDGAQIDRLDRCHWCGALLSSADDSGRPLVARPRFTANQARVAVARALKDTGRSWLPGGPQLVFYPFAPSGIPRKPYIALAQLPPVLHHGWQPAGADLLTWSGATSSGVLQEGAVRVPVAVPVAGQAPVIHYPFFRVPLRQEGLDSAAWCDASSGQVVLPPELLVPATARGGRLVYDALVAIGLGAAAGLLLPFPVALVPIAALGAAVWWRAARR